MVKVFICVAILSAVLGHVQSGVTIISKGNELNINNKIVNGQDAPRGKYPWQIMLFQRLFIFKLFTCGGTILNAEYILTAAHCISGGPGSYEVAVGKYEMNTDDEYTRRFRVEKITIHENYRSDAYPYDIALLKLRSSIVYNENVQPVNLAAKGESTPRRNCWASGHGLVNQVTEDVADILQELETKAITKDRCLRLVRRYVETPEDLITDQVVCTKDRRAGVCSGDSGGPLGCFDRNGDYTQYGILSWGSAQCDKGFNVYTRVSEYRDWIAANMM